jgi:hypothetical protein
MFQPYFDHIQALIYINQGEYALKIYFVIYEILKIKKNVTDNLTNYKIYF